MAAVNGGHVEIVKVLIQAGADVNLEAWVSCWSEQCACIN